LKDHQHAFILPLGNGQRIERILIYTRRPEGFAPDEVRAILRMQELYGASAEHPIRAVAVARGGCEDDAIRRECLVVESTTPFVAARHWRKGRGSVQEFLMEEVRRECRNHGIAEPVKIEPVAHPRGVFEWVEFRRNRKDDAAKPGYGFRLEFATAVREPFSLGYGCHFGLGQFAAVK
jgi:CRISPR-associated protein Csb2